MVEIKLLSGFEDYYDHHFDDDGTVVWHRVPLDMTGHQRLTYLNNDRNLPVVPYGELGKLLDVYKGQGHKLIDLNFKTRPAGGGRAYMVNGAEVTEEERGLPATLFTPSTDRKGKRLARPTTYSLFLIGDTIEQWIKLTSGHNWRSDFGQGTELQLLKDTEGFAMPPGMRNWPYPLVCIDFIPYGGRLVAFSFTTMPRLKALELNVVDVAEAIKVKIIKSLKVDITD